ncbi:MAG: 50S ribosomal protein L4 [Alphaproteobacteria bacterium]
MISVSIHNADGTEVGNIEVDEAKLGGQVHRQALREAILMHQARRRLGTAAAKTRSEVKGTGRKPWRQKGTGRARSGSFQSPLRPGGGVVFGPKPRDYSYSIPKKVRRRAIKSALLAKLLDGEVVVVDGLGVPGPKTSYVAEMLNKLGVSASCLIVPAELDRDLYLAARNIPNVAVLPAAELNAYDIVVKQRVLIAKQALDRFLGE